MNGLDVKNNKLHNAAKQLQIAALMLLTVLFTAVSVNAQSTTIKLPTTDNTSDFKITDNAATPVTLFKLSADGSLLSNGTYTGTTAPSLGTGPKLWWYPKIAAFRVGYVNGTQWGSSNIGDYSFASGYNTTAKGDNSTALGDKTTASGTDATALGTNTTASGNYSTAMGNGTRASKINSTALGNGTIASGINSTALGTNTTASGDYSTAMGNDVSTNSHPGSFIIGDNSTGGVLTTSTAIDQMMMRFDGGYVLYTSAAASSTVAAYLNSGTNSWSTTSDSTKKYAFLPVNGERVLNKLGKFNLRSWSYKGQDKNKFRHYGPMAQEFFNAFGHDQYGIAGNDTTINQADFEGINLIAIQALEKRTDDLKSVQKELKSKTEEIAVLKQKVDEQQNQFAVQQKQINELNKMKTEFTTFKKAMAVFLESSNKANNTKVAMNK